MMMVMMMMLLLRAMVVMLVMGLLMMLIMDMMMMLMLKLNHCKSPRPHPLSLAHYQDIRRKRCPLSKGNRIKLGVVIVGNRG